MRRTVPTCSTTSERSVTVTAKSLFACPDAGFANRKWAAKARAAADVAGRVRNEVTAPSSMRRRVWCRPIDSVDGAIHRAYDLVPLPQTPPRRHHTVMFSVVPSKAVGYCGNARVAGPLMTAPLLVNVEP